MSLSYRFISIFLLLVTCSVAVGVAAQSELLHGPILGFTPDSSGAVIWPILGIPGASVLGDRLALDAAIHGARISPKQDYALAVRNEDARAVVFRLSGASPALSVIPGADFAADLIA